jgi:hypothetical protein
MDHPGPQLVAVLDQIGDGADHSVAFQLFGVAAQIVLTIPGRKG